MRHAVLAALCVFVGWQLTGCAPSLRSLPFEQQRERGEQATVEACGFSLDVESTITARHRRAWAVAHEYIDIVSSNVEAGGLSRFLSAETQAACQRPEAAEAGGVRAAVGQLIHVHGTYAEVLRHVATPSSPEFYCRHAVPADDPRYAAACEQLGFPVTPGQPLN